MLSLAEAEGSSQLYYAGASQAYPDGDKLEHGARDVALVVGEGEARARSRSPPARRARSREERWGDEAEEDEDDDILGYAEEDADYQL